MSGDAKTWISQPMPFLLDGIVPGNTLAVCGGSFPAGSTITITAYFYLNSEIQGGIEVLMPVPSHGFWTAKFERQAFLNPMTKYSVRVEACDSNNETLKDQTFQYMFTA